MTTTPASSAIRCPHCGREVQLDEAIAHQLAAPMRAGWEAEIRQQIGEEVRAAYASELEVQRAGREELEGRLRERDSQIQELKAHEAGLLRDRRKLEDEKDDLEREKERARDEIRKQERVFADRRASQRAEEELRRAREAIRSSCAARRSTAPGPGSWKISSNGSAPSWRRHSARAAPACGNRKASPARTCLARNSSGASPPT
jgi:DNA repair exonuclease SbcCD ATPase subunit